MANEKVACNVTTSVSPCWCWLLILPKAFILERPGDKTKLWKAKPSKSIAVPGESHATSSCSFLRTITAAQTTPQANHAPVWVPYLNFEKMSSMYHSSLFCTLFEVLGGRTLPYLKATYWIIEHTIFCSSVCATGFLLVPKSSIFMVAVKSTRNQQDQIPYTMNPTPGLRFACQVSLHTLAALWRGENIVGANKWWQPLLFIGIKNV